MARDNSANLGDDLGLDLDLDDVDLEETVVEEKPTEKNSKKTTKTGDEDSLDNVGKDTKKKAPVDSIDIDDDEDDDEEILTEEEKEEDSRLTELFGPRDKELIPMGPSKVTKITFAGQGMEDREIDKHHLYLTVEVEQDIGLGDDAMEVPISLNTRVVEDASLPLDERVYVEDEARKKHIDELINYAFNGKIKSFEALAKFASSKNFEKLVNAYGYLTVNVWSGVGRGEDQDGNERIYDYYVLTDRHRQGASGKMPDGDLFKAAINSKYNNSKGVIRGRIVSVKNNVPFRRYEIGFQVAGEEADKFEGITYLATYKYAGSNDEIDRGRARKQAATISTKLHRQKYTDWEQAVGEEYLLRIQSYDAQFKDAKTDEVYRAKIYMDAGEE